MVLCLSPFYLLIIIVSYDDIFFCTFESGTRCMFEANVIRNMYIYCDDPWEGGGPSGVNLCEWVSG